MDTLVGIDVYLRIGKSPIQQFRAWNPQLFIDSRVNEGLDNKDGPILVQTCTREQYRAEKWKKKS